MNKPTETPEWLVYQRCVAAFAHEKYGNLSVTVQPNVLLTGSISGVKRQIDVLIDARWGDDVNKRIIVDAKFRKNKIDINDVESIIGMMADCRADRAVLICTSGYTEAAHSRAQEAINISILPFEEALDYSWIYEPCLGKCSSQKSIHRLGMVLWGEHLIHGLKNGFWLMLQTGKCDVCHSFHVWCSDCGEKFAVPDEHIITCYCGRKWASVPESLESGHIGEPTSIWLLMREDDDINVPPTPFDRKPIK